MQEEQVEKCEKKYFSGSLPLSLIFFGKAMEIHSEFLSVINKKGGLELVSITGINSFTGQYYDFTDMIKGDIKLEKFIIQTIAHNYSNIDDNSWWES
mgnify:CR=1 FL=1|tara:strand:- start:427 stop:717 length:291 start_codon:yes stop_codon:yes gene_type:complete